MDNRKNKDGGSMKYGSRDRLAFSRRAFNQDDSVRFQRQRKIRGLAHELFLDTVAREISRRRDMARQRPLRILDVGCGSGPWIEALLDHAASLPKAPPLEIAGIDVADRLIECASERLSEYDNVELQNCAVQDFEYEKKFDVVYLVDVLQHIASTDYESVLGTLADLIGRRGAVVIIDKEKYSLFALRMVLRRWFRDVPDYYRSASYPSFAALRRMARRKDLHPRRQFRKRQFGVLVLNKAA